MKYKPEIKLNSYLELQVHNEENYYKDLAPYIVGVILALLNNGIDKGRINTVQLFNIAQEYKLKNKLAIEKINRTHAQLILSTANYAINTTNSNLFNIHNLDNLTQQINIRCDNLMNAAISRIYTMVPLGIAAGLYVSFFTDETSKQELFERTNKSVMKFVRDTYTQGVINSIIGVAKLSGYTEYEADNRHDDRVRPLHAKYFRLGNWIRFDDPPECGSVGTESGCRCEIVALR